MACANGVTAVAFVLDLITSTSLGDQHDNRVPKVVSDVVIDLVLEGWRGVRGDRLSGSGVVSCLTVACRRFLGASGGGVGGCL